MACNNCLQEILEGEPFWEDETEGTAYHQNCRQAALDRRNKAEDERAALIARAEAAEAEAARLKEAGRMVQEEVTAWRDSYEALNEQRLALAARVAELESHLAAQQWRPGNAEPPAHGWYWVYDFAADDAPTRRFYGPQGWGMHGDEAAPDWHMAIAPLPTTEPTP